MNPLLLSSLLIIFVFLNYSNYITLFLNLYFNTYIALPEPQTRIKEVVTTLAKNLDKLGLFNNVDPKIVAFTNEKLMYKFMMSMEPGETDIILANYVFKQNQINIQVEAVHKETCLATIQGQIISSSNVEERIFYDIVCNQLIGSMYSIFDDTQLAYLLNWKVYYHLIVFLNNYQLDQARIIV